MLHPMMMTLFVLLFLTLTQDALSDTSIDWDAGQAAFAQGDYDAALRSFRSARTAGLNGPAIHYNIAVCHFKLNDFDQAGQGFARLGERYPKMRGLAEYNLGLVARRTGDAAAARRHFLRAYELSPNDEKLRVMSSRRLRAMEPETSLASDWLGAIGFRVGRDDNVALRDEIGLPAGVTTDSNTADLFGSIKSPWDGRRGIRFEGSAYVVRYFDADEFDQSDFRGRLYYDVRVSDWRLEIGAHAAASTLGGDAFDRKTGIGGRGIWDLDKRGTIDIRYAFDSIDDANSIFAGIDGSRQQLDVRYRWRTAGHGTTLRYRSERNDRDDPGVSPSRSLIGFDYRYQTESAWGYEFGAYIRDSDYEDLVTPRKEELLSVRAGATRVFGENWMVLFDYRYSENDSSDPVFSYDRSQITLGLVNSF